MSQTMKKYNLYMKLEREGSIMKIKDVVNEPFNLQDYIYKHDLEQYVIVDFKLKECK